MSRIVRSASARRDVTAISLHVAAHDADAAIRLLDRIDKRVRLLVDHTRLGQRRSGGGAGLRSFTVPPYILLYEPIPGGIRLIRVLHGARDIGGSLGED